jgi:DnaJ-class molecular chaperone
MNDKFINISPDDLLVEECPSCAGLGWIDMGDPEDGITDECPTCNGDGVLELS